MIVCPFCTRGTRNYVEVPPGYFTNQTTQLIVKCLKGHHCVGDVITPCQVGTYADSKGFASCLSCPPGKYTAINASTSCTQCTGTTIAANAGEFKCTLCPSDHYPSNGSIACIPIPFGVYYVDENGEPTQYQNSTKVEYKCIAGNKCRSGRMIKCPAGRYADSGALRCDVCLAGTYTNSSSSPTCHMCPVGSISNSSGQTSCHRCDNGTYSSRERTLCLSIVPGTYFVKSKQYKGVGIEDLAVQQQNQCPSGSWCSGGKANDCDVGTFSTKGATQCTKCPPGRFVNHTTASECVECSTNTFSVTGATSCTMCSSGKC